jgi:hypothetical protein
MAPKVAIPAASPPVKGSVPPFFFGVVAAASTAVVFAGVGSPLVAAGLLEPWPDGVLLGVLVVVVVVDALTAWALAHDGESATSTHSAPSPPPSLVRVSGHDAATGAPDSVAGSTMSAHGFCVPVDPPGGLVMPGRLDGDTGRAEAGAGAVAVVGVAGSGGSVGSVTANGAGTETGAGSATPSADARPCIATITTPAHNSTAPARATGRRFIRESLFEVRIQ